ncbi:carbohydrate ABC transporter permease [Deinococcus apachensis]|uniref:carbohydrate ABC transporter permease n=1 Tax=Deinococcus apachensis TaxID=309886 RepID=UPI000362C00F|nr:carbohydrate ABC transporter permease [Deinococcus apachensis]
MTRLAHRRAAPLVYAAYLVVGLLAALPILWVVSMSFKSLDELFTVPPRWIPARPTLENYHFVLFGTPIPRLFLNSTVVACCTAALALGLATVAGYAFSRFNFRHKGTWLLLLLGTQMIPGVSNVIPLYMMMRQVHLLDTLSALILIYSAAFVPFSIWIMKASFDRIPATLDEAAMIDGASRFGAFRRVVLPLVRPGLLAAGTMVIVNAWNEFFLALILTSSVNSRTIATGMYMFQGQYGTNAWQVVSAAAIVATLVPLLLFAFFQNHMVGGFSAGAVKE